jgi:hypothetical protein
MSRLQLNFNNGNAGKASTWVCKTPGCNLPFFREAILDAEKKGISIGLHISSRSIVVNVPDPLVTQRIAQRLETILGKGGAVSACIEGLESFDLFHAEEWGLVKINAPVMPYRTTLVVEGDDLSDEEVQSDEDVDGMVGPLATFESPPPLVDIFALVSPSTTVRIDSTLETLNIEAAHEKERRSAFEACGPLSPYLESQLFTKGIKHTEHVQNQQRSIAAKAAQSDPIIHWITSAPESITVYTKPKMSIERRVEWIQWKANTLNMDLTLPVFMAFFKQMSASNSPESRLKTFKAAVMVWQGGIPRLAGIG